MWFRRTKVLVDALVIELYVCVCLFCAVIAVFTTMNQSSVIMNQFLVKMDQSCNVRCSGNLSCDQQRGCSSSNKSVLRPAKAHTVAARER